MERRGRRSGFRRRESNDDHSFSRGRSSGVRLLVFETIKVQKTRSAGFFTSAVETYIDDQVQLRELPAVIVAGALIVSLVAAFLYPLVGALAVRVCAALHGWAWIDSAPEWPRSVKLVIGAFWPITLIASTIIYIFLGVIHRIY
jgi:hypothetical protein